MTRRTLYTLSLLYLSLPVAIFMVGWLPWGVGIPLAAVAIWATIAAFRGISGRVTFGQAWKEWVMAVVIILLVVHAGVGGFAWQIWGDHLFRNALFETLFREPWPLVRGDEMVCYYLGFWLPAALGAKIVGSYTAARLMLVAWSAAGLWLTMRLIFDTVGSTRLRLLWVFLFFGGVDVIPFLLYGLSRSGTEIFTYDPEMILPGLGSYSPLAWWDNHAASLYYIYNQRIPALLGTMLVVGRERRSGVIPLTLSTMLINCPFPAIGLLPAGAWLWWRSSLRKLDLMSWPLAAAIIIAVPVMMFFGSNSASHSTWIYFMPSVTFMAKVALHYVVLVGFTVGVWLPFVWRGIRRDTVFWILFVTSSAALFIRMGQIGFDFASRAFEPMLMYVCLYVCRYVNDWNVHARGMRLAFVCVAVLALMSPACEVIRTSVKMHQVTRSQWYHQKWLSPYEFDECRDNFVTPLSPMVAAAARSHGVACAPAEVTQGK